MSRTFRAHLTSSYSAIHDGPETKVRPIEIPQDEIPMGTSRDAILERAFFYGQNDFQPREGFCSVSCGDVIEITVTLASGPSRSSFYRVVGCGFETVDADALKVRGMAASDLGSFGKFLGEGELDERTGDYRPETSAHAAYRHLPREEAKVIEKKIQADWEARS